MIMTPCTYNLVLASNSFWEGDHRTFLLLQQVQETMIKPAGKKC
jgi:hypothetical protein